MKTGLLKIRKDHRDYSFHPSFGTTMPTTIPDFNFDAGLWMPNQEESNTFISENGTSETIVALPNGCTDFTQADLCSDEDGHIDDPLFIESITHANANGGGDIRTSLQAAITAFRRVAYFTIEASAPLDWFDAIRLAMYSTQDEKRSVSVGTPWYEEFENPQNGILPIPSNFQQYISWHNWKICGQKTINGIPYLIGKTWQGSNYGDQGYCYVPRELINNLLSISFTGAFTLSKTMPNQIQTVNLTIVQTIVSYIQMLLNGLKKTL